MGVRLSEDEAWRELEQAHTGILTTLKGDGWPIPLPVWFAVVDRRIYTSTPARSKKLVRLRRDPRATFLVERGLSWMELCAVLVPATATLLEPGDEVDAAMEAINTKYRGFGVPEKRVPDATRKHYGGGRVMIRLDPAGPLITWDNAKIRLSDVGSGTDRRGTA